METAQIVQSIRQQEIQQNGISSGISFIFRHYTDDAFKYRFRRRLAE